MGFFSALKDAAVEANEEAHGNRLLTETQSTFACIQRLDDRLKNGIAVGYLEIRARIVHEMLNWSKEGRIKIGRQMQSQAREKFDLDLIGSYSKWLSGAWIESKERNSFKAQQAFELLDGLAGVLDNEIRGGTQQEEIEMGFGYNTWDQWLLEFKKSAGRTNTKLSLDKDNKSFIDFMDQSPLKRAFNDKVDPIGLGRQFAQQFDINSFGAR